MAKQVKAKVKLQIPGGGATPAPPVGSTLGQHGVSIMEFCKQFNAASAQRRGETVPVEIIIYKDKSFDFVLKTPPVTELLLKKANLKKGAQTTGTQKIGSVSQSDLEEIAKIKMPDLNANDIEAAKKIVAGSARSIGLTIVD